jgi:drug/metabolite transporter (DMT)-like permease
LRNIARRARARSPFELPRIVSEESFRGVGLALVTAVSWGLMPIALKSLLSQIDPVTLTAVRLLLAAVVLAALQGAWRERKAYWHLLATRSTLHLVAFAGLIGNFLLFLFSLGRLTPVHAQVLAQCGPLFLIMGGAWILREPLSRMQVIGVCLAAAGMGLFFNRSWLNDGGSGTSLGIGHLMAVLGAASWAIFALAQRRLSASGVPARSLLLLYAAASLVLIPASKLSTLLYLDGWQISLVLLVCANTVLGYGALVEALRHLDAARVGAIIATTPLITAAGEWLLAKNMVVTNTPAPLNSLAIAGTLLLVVGSAVCALGGSARLHLEK